MHYLQTMCCSGVTLPRRKVVAVIHARMGSSRFPGKMLATLGHAPVLEWVIRRTLKTESVDAFVLATSDLHQDDVLATLGKQLEIPVFRGSLDDVLTRVVDAAEEFQADAVLRICADNPFVDPAVLTLLVTAFRKNWSDYAFNHRPAFGLDVADGFGGEIFDLGALAGVRTRFDNPRYREHLTSPFWDHPEIFSIQAIACPNSLRRPELRFDVDTPGDLEFLNSLVLRGQLTFDSSAEEIIRCADE